MDQPTLRIASARTFALGTGLTENDIAGNALSTLSGSGQVAPTYWLDTKTGVSRLVNLQTPQSQLTTLGDLETVPIDHGDGNPSGTPPQLLGALSRITQTGSPLSVSHYSILPVVDIYAGNAGRDPRRRQRRGGRRDRPHAPPSCRTAPRSRCTGRPRPWAAPTAS